MSHREKVVYIKIFQSPSSGCHIGEGERERAGKKEAKTEECEARERNISHTIKNLNTDREKDKSYLCQEKGERPLSAYG